MDGWIDEWMVWYGMVWGYGISCVYMYAICVYMYAICQVSKGVCNIIYVCLLYVR